MNNSAISRVVHPMKTIFTILFAAGLALSTLAQAPSDNPSAYPTKMETLLRSIGVVINSSSQPTGSVEGRALQSDTNILTIFIRTQVIGSTDKKAREDGVALQMRDAHQWHSHITYVDYEELPGLITAINRLMALQPELPVVQAKYETRGGLYVATYSTEKREVLARIQINNDESNQIKISREVLKDFRDLLLTAKRNLDLQRTAK